jgi:hypothetical protein
VSAAILDDTGPPLSRDDAVEQANVLEALIHSVVDLKS